MSSAHTATAGIDGEVMGAIDEEASDKRFVVADVSRDDAWVATPLSDAATLEEWQ